MPSQKNPLKDTRNWHSLLLNETSQAKICGDSVTFPQFPTFLKFFFFSLLSFVLLDMDREEAWTRPISSEILFNKVCFYFTNSTRVHIINFHWHVIRTWPTVSGCPLMTMSIWYLRRPLLKNKLTRKRSCHTHKLCSNSSNHCLFTYPHAST